MDLTTALADRELLRQERDAYLAEVKELRAAVVAMCDTYSSNRSEKQRVKAFRTVAAKAVGPFSLTAVGAELERIEQRDRGELLAALKVALDGWAVHAFGLDHPDRPDSMTDAELLDQEEITKLRTKHGL